MAGADGAVAKAAAAGTGPAVGESRGWPLHRYLVGLVVLFVVAAATGVSYAGAAWWSAAMRGPMLIAPAADPRTGSAALLCSIPVAGSGLVAGFVNLAVLGGVLGDLYGGPRHLTFLVTTADGGTVLTRSADPGRWVGA